MTNEQGIKRWVDEVAKLTTPDRVVYCTGSEEEKQQLIKECLATGGVIAMLSPYTAEVYPTRYRGTGSGLSAGSSKLGGLVAGIGSVTGLLAVSGNLSRPAIVVSIPMAVAALLVAAWGLETRGRRLEDLADHHGII